ncbi:MAG: RagB/SusD family nutrient uptake outer membrane protein [Tannerellaceae bacterium]|jgi:hypothetical protein|nr:RagB/SusD family nutrient uptake outer membrane protein [Tannerellaceae bacterium]
MKIKIISPVSVLIVMLAALSGCQDIDLLPKDNLSDPQFWKTPSDFQKAANYLYSRMESFNTDDNESDIAFGGGANSVSSGTYIAPNAESGYWNDRFADLRGCNQIIEKAETYAGDMAGIEVYAAEARFFRAYTLWRLMKRYNDVQLITKTLNVESPELYGERTPQATVEDFILSELEAIWQKLPLEKNVAAADKGRITQGAALALKARVALFAGTWAKYHGHREDYAQLLNQAIVAAETVRTGGEYSIWGEMGDESYRYMFIEQGDDNSESILANRYVTDIRTHGISHQAYWGDRSSPTKKMADMYLCKSTGLPITAPGSGFAGYDRMADEYTNRDPRMTQTFLMPGTTFLNAQDAALVNSPLFNSRPNTKTGYKLWKFIGEARTVNNQTTYDCHIIRYAEVLLILAEATFEKDGAISDEVLNNTINVIRSRKGVEMPPLTNVFVTENGLNMQTEIRRERTVELAFEGFRRDDLKRWKTAETELVQAIKGFKYTGTEYEEEGVLSDSEATKVDENGFYVVEPAENRKFVAPKNYYNSLPLDETKLNPKLLPNNPGW